MIKPKDTCLSRGISKFHFRHCPKKTSTFRRPKKLQVYLSSNPHYLTLLQKPYTKIASYYFIIVVGPFFIEVWDVPSSLDLPARLETIRFNHIFPFANRTIGGAIPKTCFNKNNAIVTLCDSRPSKDTTIEDKPRLMCLYHTCIPC